MQNSVSHTVRAQNNSWIYIYIYSSNYRPHTFTVLMLFGIRYLLGQLGHQLMNLFYHR